MKCIEIIASTSNKEQLQTLLEQQEIEEHWSVRMEDPSLCCFRLIVGDDKRQPLMDSLQATLKGEHPRIIVSPIEAVVLKHPHQDKDIDTSSPSATREELYSSISKGAQLNANFVFFVIASVIVAAIGLLEDNIAVVIGAMVIAPLLGPNVALAFSAVLGDLEFLWRSLKINAAGLLLTLGLSLAIGFLWPVNLLSNEILARTDIGYGGVALALASGAAAVLSLTSGVSSALVGVMVAVALMPPAVTLGMLVAAGEFRLATGASLLLAGNVICVNLSASLVFLLKGIKPRTWLEKRKAQQSIRWSLLFWTIALSLLLLVIYIRQLIVSAS